MPVPRLALGILCLLGVRAFTPTVYLNGPLSSGVNVQSIPNHIAYKYMKRYQIDELKRDSPKHICLELNNARELLRGPDCADYHVSFVMSLRDENPNPEHLYTLIYTMNDKFPRIYTVEALVRTPSSSLSVSVVDIETILNQMCVDRRGYIQYHPLNLWVGGRYAKELSLEKRIYC